MKILITDDHAVVRLGLKQLLAAEFKRATFGEAANAAEAIDHVSRQNWDVVVLDLNMPGRGGLEVLREIKKIRPQLPVVILSMHPEDQFAMRLLKAGAAGYLTKETAPEQLVCAIRKVVAGGHYVSPALAEQMVSFLGVDVQVPPHERLSDREFLVLRLLAAGKPVSAIARELSLSVKTISTYRQRTLEKMGMANNAELIRYAIQKHLVEKDAENSELPPDAAAPKPAAPESVIALTE
jgi:DNA-binding NarL/FixJ family response regulator